MSAYQQSVREVLCRVVDDLPKPEGEEETLDLAELVLHWALSCVCWAQGQELSPPVAEELASKVMDFISNWCDAYERRN